MKIPGFLTLLIFIPFFCFAQSIPLQSKIFIEKMPGDLDSYLAGEFLKQKVPVKILTVKTKADYIISGTFHQRENKWHDSVSQILTGGSRDKSQGSLKMIDKKDNSVVWAGNAGDKTFWFGGMLARKGPRKLAVRLVKQFRKDLFRKK